MSIMQCSLVRSLLRLAALFAAFLFFGTSGRAATITYVQSNSAVPASGITVKVTYANAQAAGDLNIVAIGWSDASTIVSAITDSMGNVYNVAAGPTVQTGTQSAVVYYAKNIAAATANGNTVTVTFSASAPYPDVRILEYSGLDTASPLDISAAASGTSSTSDSGAATTTAANELIFGANYVQTDTASAGAGFAKRLITSPDGDIAEDEIVTVVGSYHAKASLSSSGRWIMQLAAFKAAAGTGGTPPTAPTNLTATPVSSSQINLSWTASTSSSSTIAGYRVERCSGAACTSFAQIASPSTTTYSDAGLTASTSYSYRVRAIDATGLLSSYSNTAAAATQAGGPPPPTFVQANSALPAAGGTVQATFTTMQMAGDLNIVAIGWNDATTQVTSVMDTMGNIYSRATAPTVQTGVQSMVVYYAKNISGAAANGNTVTVNFSVSVPYPDIRILEYAGLDTTSPLDVAVGASGTGGISDSGAATTTNANDLIFGANYVQSDTASAGAGFTKRLLTSPDGDIAEDQLVSTTGNYHATATLSTSSGWVMQLAAFKAATTGTGGGTPPTVSITSPTQSASLAGTVTVTATASATGGTIASVQFMVDNSNIGSPVTTAPYSISWNTATVANGTHTLTALAIDSNNNKATSPGISVTTSNAGPPATPTFVQSNYAVPSTPQTTVSVPYLAAESAGDVNIVAIGWNDTSAAVSSVTDTSGNAYAIVVGPTQLPSVLSQVIYYSKGIAAAGANANTVLVSFSAAASYPDVRVLEYSGIDVGTSVDMTASATGTSATSDSGGVFTTNANDLIFGANYVETSTSGPGTSFTSRGITSPDGDIVEDMLVSTTNTYHATANLTGAGNWVMQMVALRAAGSPPPSPPPNPPTVSITAPANNSTVSGTVTVSATASDVGSSVTSVQFFDNGASLGSPVTASPYSISVDTTTLFNGPHTITAIASNPSNQSTTSSPVSITVANSSSKPAGQWYGPYTWPLVGIHSLLLETGKVLTWEDETTSPASSVWDPASSTFTPVPYTSMDLFCSGHAQLRDGRILVAGGHITNYVGINNATLFDPVAQTWSSAALMAYARWYPTVTTLPDGRFLATSGAINCEGCNANTPEVYDPTANTWTQLTAAAISLPLYPHMFVLPNGNLFVAGSYELPVAGMELNVATQTWTTIDSHLYDGGSSVMYLPGKILKAGTSANSNSPYINSAATAYTIDLTQASPAWQATSSMANPRTYLNLTMLPDGTVLATGGETTTNPFDLTKAVYAAELWVPSTGNWATLGSMQIPRVYHSTALLLPDARVLVAGSGEYGPGSTNQLNAEIFAPPYLFKGPRPTLTSAPPQLTYGQGFTVQTPNAANIASVVLIRLGTVTHAFNQNQGFIPMSFTASSGSLTVTAPANSNIAPPGFYMLFIVDTNGVPSVAQIVQFP